MCLRWPHPPAFEVASVRYGGENHGERQPRAVDLKGTRLSGYAPLLSWLGFAFYPQRGDRVEGPQWMRSEWYEIDAIAPAGTTTDDARLMLRKLLAGRLGFQSHTIEREAPAFDLVPGSGPLKLAPATDTAPGPEFHRTPWDFRVKAATLTSFAGFLSGVAGLTVTDKTGIEGKYRFDLNWSDEVQASMSSGGVGRDPVIAVDGVKQFGLKLEPAKELQKILVVDRVNKQPTEN